MPAYSSFVPGLLESQINVANDNISPGDPALGSDVVLSPYMAGLSNVQTGVPAFQTFQHIWTESDTWIYTGQIFFSNHLGDGTGTYSFVENINDSTLLKIDGVTYISDTSSTPVGTGPIELPTGWHDIEIRFGNGSGSGGASGQDTGGWSGWTVTSGFAYRVNDGPTDPLASSKNVTDYVLAQDDGSGNLFRTTLVPESASISAMVLLVGLFVGVDLVARRRKDFQADTNQEERNDNFHRMRRSQPLTH